MDKRKRVFVKVRARAIWKAVTAVLALVLSAGLSATCALAAPRIFYTDVTSGPNRGGEDNNGAYLTLFGKDFGTARGSSTVTVGGGEVARYMVWTDEKISVQIGHRAASGAIVLTTVDGSVTARDAFAVRPGNFYFISLAGSDYTGVVNDIARPFRTPNFVNNRLQPGDFMIIRGGTYDLDDGTNNISYGSWWRVNSSGTRTSPISFMGYPGETVVALMNSPNLLVGTSSSVPVSNFVVADFKVFLNHCKPGNVVALGTPRLTDSACQGIVKATDARVVNLDVDGRDKGGLCSGWGDNIIEIGYSDRVKVLGVKIHNTSRTQVNEGSHLIYLSATQSGTEVGWNHVYDIPRSRAVIQVHTDNVGGKCFGYNRLTNITIHDNMIHDVAGQAILLDGGTGDVSIYNNVIYNTPLPDSHRYEDIIALRGSGGMLNAQIYNNTVYANPNYTLQGWILGIGSYMGSYCPKKLTLYNNIFVVTDAKDLYARNEPPRSCRANITSDYNIWYGSRYHMPVFRGIHDRSANPRISEGNLRLRKGSPAIDKGRPVEIVHTDIDGKNRPIGSAIDIGAYEYSDVKVNHR
jgi:ketosteroid isomerase-like protein